MLCSELFDDIWRKIPASSFLEFSPAAKNLFLMNLKTSQTPFSIKLTQIIQISKDVLVLKQMLDEVPFLGTKKDHVFRAKCCKLAADIRETEVYLDSKMVEKANEKISKAKETYYELISFLSEECSKMSMVKKVAFVSSEIGSDFELDSVIIGTQLDDKFNTKKKELLKNAKAKYPESWAEIESKQNSAEKVEDDTMFCGIILMLF